MRLHGVHELRPRREVETGTDHQNSGNAQRGLQCVERGEAEIDPKARFDLGVRAVRPAFVERGDPGGIGARDELFPVQESRHSHVVRVQRLDRDRGALPLDQRSEIGEARISWCSPERVQEIGNASPFGWRPAGRWHVGGICEQPRALFARETFDKPARTDGRLNRHAAAESARLQRVVDQVFLFTVRDAPIGVRLHGVEVRRKRGPGDAVRGEIVLQRRGQVAVLDSPAAIRRRDGQPQRCGEQRSCTDPQNSSLMPSCPYRGKFD